MPNIWVTSSVDQITPTGMDIIATYPDFQKIPIIKTIRLLKETISSKQRGMTKTCLKLVLLPFFHLLQILQCSQPKTFQ